MLPEQEEEVKQLGGWGWERVKAKNYTSQEAGFFQPRRGQEIRVLELDTSMHTHARVYISTRTYVMPGHLSLESRLVP